MSMSTEDPIKHQAGMKAARLVAEWHLGNRDIAEAIVWAYFNPDAATREIHNQQHEEPDES